MGRNGEGENWRIREKMIFTTELHGGIHGVTLFVKNIIQKTLCNSVNNSV